jgi:hypothetical protein
LVDVALTGKVPEDRQDGTKLFPRAIVGIVIGVIAFLVRAILVIIHFLRARSQQEMSVEHNSEEAFRRRRIVISREFHGFG